MKLWSYGPLKLWSDPFIHSSRYLTEQVYVLGFALNSVFYYIVWTNKRQLFEANLSRLFVFTSWLAGWLDLEAI